MSFVVVLNLMERGCEIAFMQAAESAGYPMKTANAKTDIVDGACWLHVNEVGGIRMSSAMAYLFPMESAPSNLQVLTETLVFRILLDDEKRSTGVMTSRGQINANKEVILCAGVINSPQLLMLSGIGPAAHLAQVGIPVQVDLAAVGAHLQDHVWKYTTVLHRHRQTRTGTYFLLNFFGRIVIDSVASRTRHGVQRFNERNTGREHRRKGASPSGNGRFPH